MHQNCRSPYARSLSLQKYFVDVGTFLHLVRYTSTQPPNEQRMTAPVKDIGLFQPSATNMREPDCSDVFIEAILTGVCESLSSDLESEHDIVPEWLASRLDEAFNAIASEPLPERFVTLLRQLEGVEKLR